MVLSKKQITKALIRLRGWAGWSAPVLFANPQRQVFSHRGPIKAILVLLFSLIFLRDTSTGFFVCLIFRVLVIPIPGSVVMDTEYEGEAAVSMN